MVTLLHVIFTLPVPPDQLNLSGVYTPSANVVELLTADVDPLVSASHLDSLSALPSFGFDAPELPLPLLSDGLDGVDGLDGFVLLSSLIFCNVSYLNVRVRAYH